MLRFAPLIALTLSAAAFAADQVAPASSAPQPTAAVVPAPPPVAPKLICRKTPEIGSLIRVKKDCATREEWRRRDLGARDMTRDMQATGGGSSNQ